jgi:hypothetical protein
MAWVVCALGTSVCARECVAWRACLCADEGACVCLHAGGSVRCWWLLLRVLVCCAAVCFLARAESVQCGSPSAPLVRFALTESEAGRALGGYVVAR